MPIGNGIAVTAMQMLDVYLTLANDGVARAPRLVAATIDADGERHELAARRDPAGRVVADGRDDAHDARGGRGRRHRDEGADPGLPVAGKTGTARKPPYEHPPYRYVASFVGFAPAETPRLAAIVVLDEPR